MVFYSGFCLLTSSWLFAYFPLSGRGGGSINSKLSPRSRMCSLHSSPCREGGPSSRERCCALCGVVGSSSAARRLCCACGEGALDLRCSATAVPTEERERWRRGERETEGEGEILSALSLATDRTGFFFLAPSRMGHTSVLAGAIGIVLPALPVGWLVSGWNEGGGKGENASMTLV